MIGVSLAGEPLRQRRPVEVGREGLGSHAAQQLMFLEPRGLRQVHQSEAPVIVVAQHCAIVEVQDDVLVRAAARRCIDGEAPRHAEMDDQHAAAIEVHQEILAAPSKTLHRPARERLSHVGRERAPEIGATHRDVGDAPADEARGKPAAHGFDLGQFRHPAATVARVLPLGYGRRHGLCAR